MCEFKRKLSQPPLITEGIVHIVNSKHKFANDAAPSGINYETNPIFGTIALMNGKKISEISFGLPVFRFKRGTKPKFTFINKTGFTFDLHWHGLNITADIDGASGEVEFGENTKIGTKLELNFPVINNNSCMLWVHAHPMFRSATFVYTGVHGLVDIIDEQSKIMQEIFKYGDNHIMLAYQDIDLNSDGTYNYKGLYTSTGRSCFGLLNGTSCVNWYSQDQVKYVDGLYHNTCHNLIKIDFLNGTDSFRYIHLGVCDAKHNIKTFYVIQTDDGLRNPTPLKILLVAPGSRNSILLDANDFDGEAYLFFYNFDLTEIFSMALDKNILTGVVPDLKNSLDPTPFPTPIPNGDFKQPQNNPSPLDYPIVPYISQTTVPLENGNIILPLRGEPKNTRFTINKVLKIQLKNKSNIPIGDIIEEIRKIVFGENYKKYKITNDFEYNPAINYIKLLNKDYFYNLPETNNNIPDRNFILFFDSSENSNIPGGNPLGSTELANGAARICVDLWNSNELNLEYAIKQYNLNPNNYKPSVLPRCLFKIYETNTKYTNLEMLANDILQIQLFDQPIDYNNIIIDPIAQATIIFQKQICR